MKYQIISIESNKALILDEFDKLYCSETGEEYSDERYASWHMWLEGILRTYGDIADHAKDSDLYFSVVRNSDPRRVNFLTAAKCLMIYASRLMYDYETSEEIDSTIGHTKRFRNFLISHKNDYYFEFSF